MSEDTRDMPVVDTLRTSMNRRTILRFGLTTMGAIAVAPLIAACGGDEDAEDTDDTDTSGAPAGGSSASPQATTGAEGDGTAAADEDDEGSETEPATSGEVDRSAVGGQMIFGRSGDSDSLDPHHTIAAISWQVFVNIYDTLISKNMDLELEPIVAESWEAAEDGLSYTFTIREGLTFHDGTPVNAEAVKFTFERVINPDTAAPSASWISALESVDVVDEYTARMNLSEPFSPLLGNISIAYFGILSPTAVEQHGEDFGKNPVGSGPFKFQEWVPGERITLVPFEDYQDFHTYNTNKGTPYLEELIFRNIPEEQTQIAAFETGEINLLAIPAQQLDRFEDNSDYNVLIPDQSTSISFLEFSIEDQGGTLEFMAPFDDIRVRQAVGHAVNADEIIERILQGLAIRNFGPMPTGNYGYDPAIEEFGFNYDPDQARQLLEEAGWTEGSGGVREKDGTPLEVVFWTWNATTQERIAQVIQAQLQEVGISAKLETMEVATLLARLKENQSQMDLMGWGWSEPDIMYMMTDTEGQIGLYQQYSPEYAELVANARETSVPEERAEFYFEAMKVMLGDAAMIPLWSVITVTGARAEVNDFKLGPQGLYVYQDAYQEK